MNTEKKLFNLTHEEEIAVENFAYAAVALFITKCSFLYSIKFVKEQQAKYEEKFSQECWEACMCVFWRLVGVFACPHEPVSKINICAGITEREAIMEVV